MPVGLPANLRTRPVSYESCPTIIPRSDQESRHRVDAIRKALSPLNYPIDGQRHIMRECRFDVRMNVDEVDRAGTCCGQDAKVIALWKKWIERSQGVCARVVATGNVSLRAKSRFQENGWNSVAGLGRNRPCFNVRRTESTKLPKSLVVKVPCRFVGGDGA